MRHQKAAKTAMFTAEVNIAARDNTGGNPSRWHSLHPCRTRITPGIHAGSWQWRLPHSCRGGLYSISLPRRWRRFALPIHPMPNVTLL